MKYLKISLTVFLFMFVFAVTATKASSGSATYAGITLPTLMNETRKGPKSKTSVGIQRYENFSTINSCTNNNNDIGIRVRTEANGYSDRVSVSVGSTATLPKDITTTRIDAYDLYIRNNVFSPCSAVHSGVWYFN